MHARTGLEIPYMGEEWFELFGAALRWAKELGMQVWLYDENGWPSGEAGGKIIALGDEYRAKKIKKTTEPSQIPPGRLLASYIKKGESYVPAADAEAADLYVYYELTDTSDTMYENTGRKFTELVHDEYCKRFSEYFGNVIPGIFCDEASIGFFYPTCEIPWSESMPDMFRKMHGYDVRENLWRLFETEDSLNPFLYDYYKAASELFYRNFICVVHDWCTAHGLLLTGHLCMEEAMHASYKLSGDVMRIYKEMDIPGIDLLGKRITSPVLYKQIGSVRKQFAKKEALCEIFGGAGWDTDFNQMLWAWKENALQGITIPCFHLAAYSLRGERKFDYPGVFSYQQPWWEHSRLLFSEMQNYVSFLRDFLPKTDILVISPTLSLGALPYQCTASQGVCISFRQLLEELDDAQFSYDIGDELLMQESARVERGEMVLGQMRYNIVVVPNCPSLEPSTVSLLSSFYKSGGKILFIGGYPRYAGCRPSRELAALLRAVRKEENGWITFPKKKILQKAFDAFGYKKSVRAADPVNGIEIDGLTIVDAEKGGVRRIAVFNRSADAKKTFVLRVRDAAQLLRLCGEERKQVPSAANGEECFAGMVLSPTECCFLEADAGSAVPGFRSETAAAEYTVFPRSVHLNALNSLVLDRPAISVDGRQREEEYFGKIGEIFYRGGMSVLYGFRTETKIEPLALLLESEGAAQILFNGKEITARENGWQVDRCMRRYPVADLQRIGDNVIELVYRGRGKAFAAAAAVEGDFDVMASKPEKYPGYYSVQGDFSLAAKTEKDPMRDLTAQGLWFYRGSATYLYEFSFRNGAVKLRLPKLAAVTAKIYVNGKSAAAVTDFHVEYDLSPFVKRGKNLLQLEIIPSLRNFFGPHHHGRGCPCMVSDANFRGQKAFVDYIYYNHQEPVFTEEYHMVPFFAGLVTIRFCKGVRFLF